MALSAQSGFTLMDTLAAVAVVGIGMVGVFSMLVFAQNNYRLNEQRLTGVMLAQEGIEWARNVRDSNIANGVAWNDNLSPGTYYFEDDVATKLGGAEAGYEPIDVPPVRMRRTGAHFLHSSGTIPTVWYRVVKIQNRDEDGDSIPDGLTVKSWVQWQVADSLQEHTITAFLYNWR